MRRRQTLVAVATVALVAGGVAVARAVQGPKNHGPYHLDLGPKTAPVNADVPAAFDRNGRRTLMRVCADPNNMPFSNERGDGFENKLASLVAKDLGLSLHYTWWPQRRGFVRNTLKIENCDVVMGIAAASGLVITTRPYYRSTYMFVTRRDRKLQIKSFDDPVLRHLKIGIHLMGGDDANPPPADALARRGLAANVVGFPIYGSYDDPDPPARLLDAVESGAIDVAVAWGPLAGYYAQHAHVPLVLVPVQPRIELPYLPEEFDIAMGVRHGDSTWRDQLQGAIDRHRADIRHLLATYGVPTEGHILDAGAEGGDR